MKESYQTLGSVPVLVGGTGRSGTTALARLLAQHERYAFVPAEVRFHVSPNGIPDLLAGKIGLEQFLDAMRSIWWHRRYDSPGLRGERGLFTMVERDVLDDALGDFQREYGSDPRRACRGLLHALLDPIARAAGKPTWVEMTPANARAAPVLLDVLPRARLLVISRDGRDVASSLVGLGRFNELREGLEWWARQTWRIYRALGDAPSDRVLTLSLESLVDERRDESFDRLHAFLELDDEEPTRQFRTRFDADLTPDRAHVGRWREGLSTADQDAVTEDYERRVRALQRRFPHQAA